MSKVDLKTAEAEIPRDVRRSLIVAGLCLVLVLAAWLLPGDWTLRLGEQISAWLRLG